MADTQTITIDFNRPIPLFPLEAVALLPHASAPLHVFEPRYRAMTRKVLDSHGLIAMASFEGHAWKQDYEGNPPLRPAVCVGYVLRHEDLPDGRYNLLLQGLARATILEEDLPDPDGYRQAILKPLEPEPADEDALADQRLAIDTLLNDDAMRELAAVQAVHHWLSAELPTTAVVDLATLALCHDPEQRYAMLAEAETSKRADWLVEFLSATKQTVDQGKSLGDGLDDSGLPLN